MKRSTIVALAALAFFAVPNLTSAMPTIYPRGTTIYDPEKCWNGYTVISMNGNNKEMGGSYLVDMNGNVVHEWRNLFGMPSKVFPNGVIMGSQADIGGDPGDLTVMDFDGNVLWQLPFKAPYTDYPRQHHDYQVSGNPVGYYAPGQTPNPLGDKILIDGRAPLDNPKVSPKTLQDEFIYEVDVKTKKIVWSWNASSSFDQLGLSDSAKEVISAAGGNWIHINSVSYVGPNKWWDEDPIKYSMFNPENIIWDSRHNNILGITDRKGDIVWRVGPDYAATPELKMLGQIVGQHHAHMIPKGLPGEGNILVFDNGGNGGFGDQRATRDFSRVIEFNPVTLEIVWQYTYSGKVFPSENPFYSAYISSAQRLPNGNTLITEGAWSRVFEVTPDSEIAWEYIGPAGKRANNAPGMPHHELYRAYRIPYEWVPQLTQPTESAVVPDPVSDSRNYWVPARDIK